MQTPWRWQGELTLSGDTETRTISARAERYDVAGRGRVESLPSRIILSKSQIVAGASVLGRMRHPRAQWMLRFVAEDAEGEGGARLEALASTLAARQQAMEAKFANGDVLFLFALPMAYFATGHSHFLMGVLHPPSAGRLRVPRPDVKVWRGTVVLCGFGTSEDDSEKAFLVSAYRPSTRKQPTRTVASSWPNVIKLNKASFVQSSSLSGINSPTAQWFVRIVPLGSTQPIWNTAAAHIQDGDLAVEIPTSNNLRYSLYITAQDVHGRGLEIIGVFGPRSSSSSSSDTPATTNSNSDTNRPRNRIGVHHL